MSMIGSRRLLLRVLLMVLLVGLMAAGAPLAADEPDPESTYTVYLPRIYREGWQVEYYDNATLSGTPAAVTFESYQFPSKDWGTGAPISGVGADHFSVRWTSDVAFEEGYYEFYCTMDDGARMWVGEYNILDDWNKGGTRTIRHARNMTAGTYEVRIEYFEDVGEARIRCFWYKGGITDHWRVEYFANSDLSGSPALVTTYAHDTLPAYIDRHWGTGSPGTGVPADRFSARFTRAYFLDPDRYVFFGRADDGFRLYVDHWTPGKALMDYWSGHVDQTKSAAAELFWRGGPAWYIVTWEYREDVGEAHLFAYHLHGGPKDEWSVEYYQPYHRQEGHGTIPDDATPCDVRLEDTVRLDLRDNPCHIRDNPNNFAVRWKRTVELGKGEYTFRARYDDGLVISVNGHRVINDWNLETARTREGKITLHEGWHVIRIDYFQAGGHYEFSLIESPVR